MLYAGCVAAGIAVAGLAWLVFDRIVDQFEQQEARERGRDVGCGLISPPLPFQ